MPSDWTTYPLEECMSAIIDYRGKSPNKTASGVPLITAKIVKGGRIEEPSEFIAEEEYDAWMRRGMPQKGDVVFTTEAPLGEVAQLDGRRIALAQRIIALRGKSGVLDNTFLKFLMQSFVVQEELKARSTGTTVLGIKQSELRKVQLPLPPYEDQVRIGDILGALDDKIELNRRMNGTLEAMAQALFKEWFVDGAKEEWQPGTVGDVAIQFKAGIKPDDMTAKMAYIGLEHMPQRSIALSEWSTAETLESNKFQFKQGDILFGKLRSYFHKVGVAPIDGVCSTDIVVVRPKSPEWFGFVLGHVSSSAFVDHTSSGATGTRMPRTNWQDMARYELNMPPIELADEFTALIQPLIDRIIANIHESRTLTALRDTLLPKLMRGEVRVKKQHFMAQHKD